MLPLRSEPSLWGLLWGQHSPAQPSSAKSLQTSSLFRTPTLKPIQCRIWGAVVRVSGLKGTCRSLNLSTALWDLLFWGKIKNKNCICAAQVPGKFELPLSDCPAPLMAHRAQGSEMVSVAVTRAGAPTCTGRKAQRTGGHRERCKAPVPCYLLALLRAFIFFARRLFYPSYGNIESTKPLL